MERKENLRNGEPDKELKELEKENEMLRQSLQILLNGLNCIGRTAYLEGVESIEEGTCCLSHLIQYNMMQKDRPHSLARELAGIEQYLYIQKMRMGKYLAWEISVDEDASAYQIPNMMLYPAVERAVIHGIGANVEGGKLYIRSQWEAGQLQIVIQGGSSTEVIPVPEERRTNE